MKSQLKVCQDLNVDKDKLINLKDTEIQKKNEYIKTIENSLSDIKNFVYSNMNEDMCDLFNKTFNKSY